LHEISFPRGALITCFCTFCFERLWRYKSWEQKHNLVKPYDVWSIAETQGIHLSDVAVINAGELVTGRSEAGADDDLGLIEDGAMLVNSGNVAWIGTTKEFRRKSFWKPKRAVDAKGMLVTPGFIDPHTHLAFAGTREDELERKAMGESYAQILRAGGGISRTVGDTRRATLGEIVKESGERLRQLVNNGVTTVEVKTGYGQDIKNELKLLKAIETLAEGSGAELVPTFLGLHAAPAEFRTSKEYVDFAVREMLPTVAGLRKRPLFSDCFCETGVFSREECERYLRASAELGFRCKIHADEFTDSKGASLAAEAHCVSADHLGQSEEAGLRMMGQAGVTAVLLPGTSLYSGIGYADARKAMESGCTVALGTDLSPNSWVESPQFVMGLACTALRMTPAQALLAFTVNAARALGRHDIGTLRAGSRADFVIHDLRSYRFLPYRIGGRYVRAVYRNGRRVFSASAG
jgi:imidazolonepropionase